jgi:hypothetical protein
MSVPISSDRGPSSSSATTTQCGALAYAERTRRDIALEPRRDWSKPRSSPDPAGVEPVSAVYRARAERAYYSARGQCREQTEMGSSRRRAGRARLGRLDGNAFRPPRRDPLVGPGKAPQHRPAAGESMEEACRRRVAASERSPRHADRCRGRATATSSRPRRYFLGLSLDNLLASISNPLRFPADGRSWARGDEHEREALSMNVNRAERTPTATEGADRGARPLVPQHQSRRHLDAPDHFLGDYPEREVPALCRHLPQDLSG